MHLTAHKKYQSSKITALVKTLKAIKQAICNYVKLFPLFYTGLPIWPAISIPKLRTLWIFCK